jgi:hypothetical protein
MLNQGGEREKYTLEMSGHVQREKGDPRHKGSPRYRIAHGWKMRMDLLNLKP